MEDILQEAIVQTIPEVIAEVTHEVREEQESLALQRTQVLVEGAMPESDETMSLAVSLGSSTVAPPPFKSSEALQTSEAEKTIFAGSSGAPGTVAMEGIGVEKGGSIEVSAQVEPTLEGGETVAEDLEEERLKDCFIQGIIAPNSLLWSKKN